MPGPRREFHYIRPGASVRLKGGPLATVDAVLLRPIGPPRYRVHWFDGGNRHAAWIDPSEIDPTAGGFADVVMAAADDD